MQKRFEVARGEAHSVHGTLGLLNQIVQVYCNETVGLEFAFVAGGFHKCGEDSLVGKRKDVRRCALVNGAMSERLVKNLDQRLVLDRYGFRLQTDELEVL